MLKTPIISLLLCFTLGLTAQVNLIPDPGFELGSTSGGRNDYYNYNGTVWRAWPSVSFYPDKEIKHNGERALKVAWANYDVSNRFKPSFRLERYIPLDNASYIFSFFYKTDKDRTGETFKIDISEGASSSELNNFFSTTVPIHSAAKDGFVEFKITFTTGKAMSGHVIYIKPSFLVEGEGSYLYLDDVSLLKVLDTPKAWGPNPGNGASGVPTSQHLGWQSGKGAVKHHVYLGKSAEALHLVAENITEKQFTPSNLAKDTQYFWRIDEIDASGKVSTGDVWNFTTVTFYDEYKVKLENERIESEAKLKWEQFGPGDAGYINFLRYHPTLPDICICSPDMYNTYQTEDNGKTWFTVKDHDGTGGFARLRDLYYSSKAPNIAVAIESSYLSLSVDTGRSWTTVLHCPWYDYDSEGRDSKSWYNKVSALALDPQDENTWYVGAGHFMRGQQQLGAAAIGKATLSNPYGEDSYKMGEIYKTSDAGKTWQTLTSGIHPKAQFSRIIVHPRSSDTLFAASTRALYRSTNAGASWQDIGAGQLDNNMIMDMDFYYDASRNKFILYVIDQVRYAPDGQSTKNSGGLFKTLDNGETWTKINGNLGLDLNRLTGGTTWNYYKFIAKWMGISQGEAEAQYPNLPTNAVQYFNLINVDPSNENNLYLSFHDAQTQSSFMPGRLWKTNNGGQTWINTAREYEQAWVNDSVYWKERNNPVHDNLNMGHYPGIMQFGDEYAQRSCRYTAVNSRGDVMFIFSHNINLSTDGGESFTQVDEDYTPNGNIMGRGNSNLPGECLYQDKRYDDGIALFGSGEHRLWITTLDGTDGRQAAKWLNEAQESVFAIATHPWNENILFTTSMRQHDMDRIYRSTNRGENFLDWGQATEAEESMRTNHIRIDPIHPNYMYFGVTSKAAKSGQGGTGGADAEKEGGFHRSVNGGKSFTPSNSGMPEKPMVSDIEFDPRDPSMAALYAALPYNYERGTNGGLYHSTDRGSTWTEILVDHNIDGVNNLVIDQTGRIYVTAGWRYAKYNEGGVYFSDDWGKTWTKIFESKRMEAIDVSPFDYNLIVVSQGTLSKNPGVFLSEDRGKTWSKCNRILGQPDKIVQIEFDVHNPTVIWSAILGSGFAKAHFAKGAEHRRIWASPGTGKLLINQKLQLSVETKGDVGIVKYKSSNTNVASVSATGEIKGLGQGACKIWVTSEDERYSDFVYLVVGADTYSKVIVHPSDTTLYMGDTLNLRLTLLDNVDASSLVYESADTMVAYFNKAKQLIARLMGTTQVKVSTPDGKHFDVVQIEVKDKEERYFIASPDSVWVHAEQNYPLYIACSPRVQKSEIRYRSRNTKIATVSSDGTIEGITKGETEIIVYWGKNTNIRQYVHVEVKDKITRVEPVTTGNLSIFPNPVQNNLQITGLQTDGVYKIYDAYGRLVQNGRTIHLTIQVEELPKGTYILGLGNNGNYRFVKN